MQVKPILEEAEIANLFSSFPNKSHLLLAVSGGPDSLAMMVLAHEFLDAHPSALKFSAATVHHGLRVQALGEAHHVADIAEKLKIQHEILEWQGQKPNSKIQELAREARYNLLFAHALKIGATHVLTAHTLDDQAETILFRMMRGSGMTGLIGMQPHVKHGTIIHSRPLLDVTKQRLVATCDAHKLEYVDDASNSNMQFARVRLRKIMPALAAEGLTAQRFLDLSYRVKRADEALAARVETLWNIGRFHENKIGRARVGKEC